MNKLKQIGLIAFCVLGLSLSASAQFKQAPLPYAYDALEPYIDAQTMEIHYSKHHAGYTAKLNNLGENNQLNGTISIDETAGKRNADGINNIFIGINSGSNITTASFNTLVGFHTGLTMTGGDNNVFFSPMSWAIIYGLTFATFLTLVIIPVLYLLMFKLKVWIYKLFKWQIKSNI